MHSYNNFFPCSNLWEKAGESDGPECKASITNLTEGMEYQFRAIAVNKAGPGEPGDPSKTITAKARFGAFWVRFHILFGYTLETDGCLEFQS